MICFRVPNQTRLNKQFIYMRIRFNCYIVLPPLVANRFAAEYGVVRLSIGEVIRRLLTSQSNTDLVKQITHHLRTGCTVPDDLAVQALDVVLMDPQCQVKGYVELCVYSNNLNHIAHGYRSSTARKSYFKTLQVNSLYVFI